MSARRMFSRTIVDSDQFVDMSISARLLYYDLGMRADDDGIVNAPKMITRMIGASEDDLNELISKGFIIPFDSGVIAITHWKINNYIRRDVHTPTKYKDELSRLILDETDTYIIGEMTPSRTRDESVTNPSQERDEPVTQYSKDKDRVDKIKKEKETDDVFLSFTDDISILSLLRSFCSMRHDVGKAMTPQDAEILVAHLKEIDECDRQRALENAILNKWADVYQPNKPKSSPDKKKEEDKEANPTMDDDYEAKVMQFLKTK